MSIFLFILYKKKIRHHRIRRDRAANGPTGDSRAWETQRGGVLPRASRSGEARAFLKSAKNQGLTALGPGSFTQITGRFFGRRGPGAGRAWLGLSREGGGVIWAGRAAPVDRGSRSRPSLEGARQHDEISSIFLYIPY